MRKLLTLILLVFIYANSSGQTLTVSLPVVTAAPLQYVYIPVKLTGAGSTGVPVGSANIQISYDMSVLDYDTLTNFYSATPVSQWYFSGHDGIVAANWLEPSLGTLAIPDNTTLYEIKFTYKGGTSPLNFLVNEFTNAAYDLIPTTPVNGAVNPLPVNRQVTFMVDMKNESVSPEGVHVAGTFNNWNYSQTPLVWGSGTIYQTTVTMLEGTYMEFKFVNGNTASQAETVPGACSINGNRYFTVPGHDTVMTAYCFDNCIACGGVLHYSHVTFRVNMMSQNITPDGVHLAGTFQGWNPGTTAMLTSGDSIYTHTDSLLTGTSIQYKFVNGNTATGYETVPFACSSNGNRTFFVPANDTILKQFCFGECDTCITDGILPHQHSDFSLGQNYPNPCSEYTNINYNLNQAGRMKLVLYSSMGIPVSVLFDGTCSPGSYTLPIRTGSLPSGIYYYQMISSGTEGTFMRSKKMIIL